MPPVAPVECHVPRPALARSSVATLTIDQSVPNVRPNVCGAAIGGLAMVQSSHFVGGSDHAVGVQKTDVFCTPPEPRVNWALPGGRARPGSAPRRLSDPPKGNR